MGMSVTHLERITCDNPECEEYVDELIREEPGKFELKEYVRTQLSLQGWTQKDGLDFCPSHPADLGVLSPM
jgi:hypothetical protein